jgi:hypothetical protein
MHTFNLQHSFINKSRFLCTIFKLCVTIKKNEECDCGQETCSKQCVTGIVCTREHKADYSDVFQTPPRPPEQMWEQEYHTVRAYT